MSQPTPPPAREWEPTNPPAPPAPAPEKQRSWFARHKILTGILALVVFFGLIAMLGGGGDDDSTTAGGTVQSAAPAAGSSDAPAEEPAAEPEPAPAEQAAGIGTPVRDGKFEFTVTGVEDGGKEVGSEYLKETAQGTFKLIHITVANIGNEPQMLFDSNQKVTDDQGRQFAPNSTAALYRDSNSGIWMTEINPGNTVTGTLVYDMPEGAAPVSIELHDSMFSGGVKVALQ